MVMMTTSHSWIFRHGRRAWSTTTTTSSFTTTRQQQQHQQRLLPSTLRLQRLYSASHVHSRRQWSASSQLGVDESSWSSSLLSPWLIPRKGTGFDNFIPKHSRNDTDKSDPKQQGDGDVNKKDKDTEGETKSSNPFQSFGSNNNNNNGNKNDNNNNDTGPQGWIALMLLALVLAATRPSKDQDDLESSSSSSTQFSSRNLTWQDLHRLLEARQVEKVIVTDTIARVIVKAAASKGSFSIPQDQHDGISTQLDVMEGLGPSNTLSSNTMNVGGSSSSSSSLPQRRMVYWFNIGSVTTFERKLDDLQESLGIPLAEHVPIQYTPDSTLLGELSRIVPELIATGILIYFVRGMFAGVGQGSKGGGGGGIGGIFQIGKSNARKIAKEDIQVTFADVAGCQEAKKEIMEFVDFLQDSTRFTKLGAKIPKGALLCGPPGTGKTLLAKAVAGEANVPFYSISGSDFIEMFVGVGPSRVRDLFKEARANAPCIVFIDEIDAVGRQRGGGGRGGNDERENTLNQLLVEMDGFTPSTGVVVLAGTNRVDILDQALTRPGRFDRQIQVDKPDLQGRKEIFQVHLKGIKLEDAIDDIAGRLAGLTPGFAGADIANICNEAAIVAARRKGESVSMDDFERATDRIVGGLESNKIMSKEERSIVAHHEAGHAVAGWFLEHADPLLKVTIIPRSSGALGYAQYLPKEVFLRTEDQIMDIVCMALAGRAAEEIFFGGVTTGASDDLRRVTDLVYSTIQIYGMNTRLGQLAFPKDPNAMFDDRPYSDATAKAMDEEAKNIVDAAYQRTLGLLREKKDAVEKVASTLLAKETITHDDMIELLGSRPFQNDPAYDDFIKRRQTSKKADKGKSKVDEESSTVTDELGPLNPGLL